ncbi:inactive peptidyl-prolyl cis-trans isomerase FKBP6 [Linepithema humile]|uniref:inactive peptidyl-prolyl cis-trans isomerase FKBP6 n=1 Tax=Linepithema humile TaxID=83485 RepID=UPI00062342C5|nr:PREDICTED: inactive peptidyl-prolyl cis-trans isomerase FKBP6 [Linepithema humile]
MAKHIDSLQPGIKIDDLMHEDGITFEIGGQYQDDDDEEFAYSPTVQFSNDEMLDMLNMNDFEDEEDGDNEKETVTIYGISFEKLKTKMKAITADKKVMKYIKQKGVGEVVPHNAQVTIHYIGYFEHRDEPFDSTYISGRPKIMRVGQNCLIPGLELGILSMKKHEIAMFLIHPDLAYKALGCPPRIPPNEEVVFIVHLIDILDDGSADTYENLSIEEKQSFEYVVQSVKHMLVAAKDYFSKLNMKRAIREYKKAIDSLERVKLKDIEEETEMNSLLSQAYTNLAICYNKLDMPHNTCMACVRAPAPTVKTHYHHGKALTTLGEYEKAKTELIIAHSMQPNNESVRRAIQETNAKERQYLEIQKRLWSNCFKYQDRETKVTGFRQALRELCESIINNSGITRQVIPEGFTDKEMEIVREEAALFGLDIVTCKRYSKNQVYLQKRNF